MDSSLREIQEIINKMESGNDILRLKKKIGEVLKLVHGNVPQSDFDQLLNVAGEGLTKYCGSSQDLEELESVLDDLYDMKIIDSSVYEKIVKNTACNRWL